MKIIFAIKISLLLFFIVGFSYKLHVFLFTSTNFVFAKTSLACLDHQPGRGGGGYFLILYISHICMAAPSGRVFTPFWCENVNTLCSRVEFSRELRECMNIFIVSIPNE